MLPNRDSCTEFLETEMSTINYSDKIPNNVNLSEDRTCSARSSSGSRTT